ncbi:MAG TPA: GIY-YIG nuclease family protein, partial [Chitinophagaceae bacterium]|nr:GIY-YIG nuclease family protein [Chitinophagaceae bacterium]
EHDWLGKYWARWNDAVNEAGLQVNKLNEKHDETSVLSKIADFILEIGKYPVVGEFKLKRRSDNSFPSYDSLSRNLSKSQICQKIIQTFSSNNNYRKVVEICSNVLENSVPSEIEIDERLEQTLNGYVYLFKSGKYYKIGKSNAPGRREYELALQLPEKLITIHKIITDDPSGIEEYWHKRFASKRKNGEWFDLNNAKIKAFRKRKFM